ncbi:hypothetical protein [Microbacterium sp.]|uniref:hypothetical protein n=1 Tax=Microbacterium sp. TaxID=51671 RepID=UPI0039E22E4A
MGVPFEVKQSDGVAQVTIVSATYGAPPDLGGISISADNGGVLILDVLWETTEGTTSANPMYIDAKDAEGREGSIAIGVDSALGSGDVPTGDKMRGNVAFDIGAGPYIVTVSDTLLQEAARLTVEATAR